MRSDGAAIYRDAFKEALRPDSPLTVDEWADAHRVLTSKASAEPGRWRTSRTPYLREILRCLSPSSSIRSVVFQKASQIGGSEAGFSWIGFLIHRSPAPTMLVQPTIELAELVSKQRLAPMIEACEVLRERIGDPRSRDSGNTLLSKEFPGGMLRLAGANSAASLRSLPIKNLMLDEVDAYPKDVDGEGSPIELAEARTRTFARKKIFKVSSPTYKGASPIESAFLESDQRYFHVPCPHCGHKQALKWSGIRWKKKDSGKPDFQSVRYVCESEACRKEIEEHHKGTMLDRGEWVPRNPGADSAGFHLSALYSPLGWYSWVDAVKQWYKAQGNPQKLKVFVNTVLGETYEVKGEDAPEWEHIYAQREDRPLGTVPMRVVQLTAAVDVQKDRLEATVIGWNRREAWVVDHIVLPGDTSQPPGHGPWRDLDALLDRDFTHASGKTMSIRLALIDSGYNTMRVYEYVRTRSPKQLYAIKGQESLAMPIGSPTRVELRDGISGVRKKRGCRLWPVGTNLLKTDLMGRLKARRPTDEDIKKRGFPPTYIHFPMLDSEYFKQVTAESLILGKSKRGHAKYEWVKTYPNNEALDLLCYNIAAWYALGGAKRRDEEWAAMEAELGIQAAPVEEPASPKQKQTKPAAASTLRRPKPSSSTYWG